MAKNIEVVYGSNGLIDRVASVAQYTEQLDKLVEVQDQLVNSVHAVFDQYPRINIEMGTFATLVMNHMGTDPFQHTTMKESVLDFVRNNAEFRIFKGYGGGVRRVSDMANDPPKTEK